METESVFLCYVKHTFKKWAGFQAAIDEGMGGPYAREKEEWMGTEVENYFKTYDDVKPEDIEDYLGAMMENEFETCFEDGSLSEVSRNFCTAYPLSLTDPKSPLFHESNQIRCLRLSQLCHQKLEPNKTSENSIEDKMQQLNVNETGTSSYAERNASEENLTLSNSDANNDSWIFVGKKGKISK